MAKVGKSDFQKKKAKLDKVFSLYIRLRDSRAFHYKAFRCISCGQIKPYRLMDCGHYFSRNNMATRWDEQNCHGECSHCNRFSGDHLVGYTESLKRKIGEKEYLKLCLRHNETKKWSLFELDYLIEYYSVLVKHLQSEQ